MSLVACRECGGVVSTFAPGCPRCGAPNPGGHGDRPLRVEVRDVDMRMGSMVNFMVKWAIAAIPAVIMLAIIWAVVIGVLGGLAAGV